jgi:hypothetical protein
MSIFNFSHETLMTLIIFLSAVHILLSSIILILVLKNVQLPAYVLSGFLIISVIACLLILLYAIDCKTLK